MEEHCPISGAELTGELAFELIPEWGEGAGHRGVRSRSFAGGGYSKCKQTPKVGVRLLHLRSCKVRVSRSGEGQHYGKGFHPQWDRKPEREREAEADRCRHALESALTPGDPMSE